MNEQPSPKDKKRLAKKRGRVREYLRVNEVLPPYGESLTEEQQEIIDQISENDFTFHENYVKNKMEGYNFSMKYGTSANPGMTAEEYKVKQKRKKVRNYLRTHNVLPPYGDELTEEQENILGQIEDNDFTVYDNLVETNMSASLYGHTRPNEEGQALSRKRQRARAYLRGYGILPALGDQFTEEQQKIDDQISRNDFTAYEEMVESNRKRIKSGTPLPRRGSKSNNQSISSNAPKHVLFRLRMTQVLPPVGEPLNEIQEEIVADVKENWEGKTKSYFIVKYLKFTTPEGRLLYRAHKRHREEGYNFNLGIEDIVIPEVCPYLDLKLSTDPADHKKSNYATIDRIDSSKGYVKGNIQVISLKANSMKSSSTEEQLLQFATNGLKLINELENNAQGNN